MQKAKRPVVLTFAPPETSPIYSSDSAADSDSNGDDDTDSAEEDNASRDSSDEESIRDVRGVGSQGGGGAPYIYS